ncbi:molybdenum cofactor synthesis domain protein [Schizopora paradoxa]|uniref:Molybdenum cofactor synthesis domain protein n=1 Tax=Schizopora paradoxa TaxID=27342 RepID=A0A0H2RAU2_9AGAM|nr:molybdenum cofactor synthesis domain protein [Schizopora paradoxa]
MSFRVAVLTVSDTASKDARADKSGPLIRDLIQPHSFVVADSRIVPDNESVVKAVVATWCSSGNIDWIITTGGTGFGEHDRTPEAIKALLEREAPGLVHLLLSSSISHTPLAALSRPVAGSIGRTLVVTLPGSTKAVRENLTCLLESGILRLGQLIPDHSPRGVTVQ